MTTLPIVKHLDIVEHIPVRFFTTGVSLAVSSLSLKRSEKALDDGVVVAVALAAHAGTDAVTIDEGISLGSAIGLAWDLRDVAPRSIIRLKIPVRHFTTDGGARVLLAKERFSDLLAEVWPASA